MASIYVEHGRAESGSAYVVFGSGSSESVDLGALGRRGFRIDGAAPGDHAGWSVDGSGDVNGDGRADILVGAPSTRHLSGSAYLVFGKATSATVDLRVAADATAPPLRLGGPRSQHVLRRRSVVVTASCNEPCILRASGSVTVGTTTRLALTPAAATLAARGQRALRLTLTPKALARLDLAQIRGDRLRALVSVVATDLAGNTTKAARKVLIAS